WADLNSNGVQDPGEPGIAGVAVNLYDEAGRLLSTAVTDEEGFYSFSGLPPREYAVRFTAPPGYELSPEGWLIPSSDENIASLGDYVWYDSDHDGIQDSDEPGVAGVIVNLLNPATGSVIATTRTEGSGYYRFSDLTPGDYAVEFVKPAGYSITSQNSGADDSSDSDADMSSGRTATVTLAEGEHNPTIDAGLYIPNTLPASIGDKVWYDKNNNGIQDAGELGAAGVIVNLYDGTGKLLSTDMTDAEGIYVFTGLAPGDYAVKFNPPAGYNFSPVNQGRNDSSDSDADTVTGNTAKVTLAGGEHNSTTDAGLSEPWAGLAGLGDYVWYDMNRNGIQEPNEPGIAGVRVTLLNPVTGTALAATITDGNGFYAFKGLSPGDYVVKFDLPAGGYRFTATNSANTGDASDSDADAGTGRTAQVTLATGESNPTLDAGMYIPNTLPASLGDYVWYDNDRNGVQDAGESGVPGVRVNLYNKTGIILISSVTTNADGFYQFTGLAAGDYTVKFDLPPGYGFSTANSGNTADSADSDADTVTGRTAQITLSAGEHDPTIDAGIIRSEQTASLGNYVWYDANRNGIQDPDEQGISGVMVNLIDPETGAIIATSLTDGSGYYSFAGLTPGSYALSFEPPEGYHSSVTEPFSLLPGENSLLLPDAGMLLPAGTASLGDYVWYDTDNDGIQDPDEPGISGVTVSLRNNDGTVLATARTDGSGFYQFEGLAPGNYAVSFSLPTGYRFTSSNQGNSDTSDSDADVVSGRTAQVTLAADEHNPTLDAGMYIPGVKPAGLGDYVWYDRNRDGIQNEGEPGVAGVVVRLVDPSLGTPIAISHTDETGYYEFTGLPAGKYMVRFELPEGYNFTPANLGGNDSSDSDADTFTGRSPSVTLAAGQHNPTIDAGLIISREDTARIGDYVWYDADGNGVQNSGEKGASGVIVKLIDPDTGAVSGSTTTDQTGYYLFEGLMPGNYAVVFEAPAGYEFTKQNIGSADSADSDADAVTGRTDQVILAAGDYNTTLDAGLILSRVELASLGDYVWSDTNRNGIREPGETGVAGVTVRLIDPASGASLGMTHTDAIQGTRAGRLCSPLRSPPRLCLHEAGQRVRRLG
ncbi:MAG: hypothetical protein BWK80_60505, partial [Desulfobacteraceae bacterium IS3]